MSDSQLQRVAEAIASRSLDKLQSCLDGVSELNGFVAEEGMNSPLDLAAILPKNASDEVRQFKLKALELLLSRGADPNLADRPYGRTPIFRAVDTGFGEAVEVLFRNGADLNSQDRDGVTPLYLSLISPRRQESMALKLLELGADLDLANNAGRSARDVLQITGRLDYLERSGRS